MSLKFMHTTTNPQRGLLDSLMPSIPANEFLQRLDRAMDWQSIEAVLQAMYPATTGRPPQPPLVLYKMSLLQHCYGLSDPQCEQLVADRLSWRDFVGLGLQDKVPDETTLVRFRARLIQHGLHEQLLQQVNAQLEARGLILKTCTLVDATLVQAARRAPGQDPEQGGDADAGYTRRAGQIHYGYKAHVAVDQKHTLIRQASLTAANVVDDAQVETLMVGRHRRMVADKAYWNARRVAWLAEHGWANGILRRASRAHPLDAAAQQRNRRLCPIRAGIEKVFGWWKRCTGYRRTRYVGRDPNRLELEFKCISWNLKRLASLAVA